MTLLRLLPPSWRPRRLMRWSLVSWRRTLKGPAPFAWSRCALEKRSLSGREGAGTPFTTCAA
eukprot:10047578-Alexandrium_andersonii.AAC.1